jgi:hypothetical protein
VNGGWVAVSIIYLNGFYKITWCRHKNNLLGRHKPVLLAFQSLVLPITAGVALWRMLKRAGPTLTASILWNIVEVRLKGGFGWIPLHISSCFLHAICRSRQKAPGGLVLLRGLGTVPEKLFHPISDSDTSSPGWNQMLPRQMKKKN